MENTILLYVTDFFNRLSITLTSISVTVVGDDIDIRIETPDSPLLIGIHGKNIEAFQHLLSRMIEKEMNQFLHIHLEVNDYMKLRDEKLFRLLDSKIAFVMSIWPTTHIENLTPYERKKAHNYIAEKHIPGIKTESEGESSKRTLVLSYHPVETNWHISSSLPPPNTNTPIILPKTISDDGVGI